MARFVPLFVVLAACGGAPLPGTGAAETESAGGEAEPVPDPPPAPSASEMLAAMEAAALDPTDEEQIRELGGASAPRVYFLATIPLLAVRVDERAEEGCPSVVRDGAVTTVRGGCTDAEGTRWTGEAVLRGMSREQPDGEATYRVFGFQKTVTCPDGPRPSEWQANGTFVTARGGGETRFVINLSFQGDGVDDECRPMQGTGAVQYEGTQRVAGDASRWNGSGVYGWQGFGKVEARTEDEVVNQRNCRREALMGTTTVRSGDHDVTFRYDGETDCDEEATTAWSFDGQPQGEIAGVGCAATRSPGGLSWLLGAIVALLAGRHRRGGGPGGAPLLRRSGG